MFQPKWTIPYLLYQDIWGKIHQKEKAGNESDIFTGMEFISSLENSVNPDQMASDKAI